MSAIEAPETIMTTRLILRRPRLEDASAIFTRYASDAEVTRYLSWPRHTRIEDTLEFLAFSSAQWQEHRCGPYLIESREQRALLGSTGLDLAGSRAMTGYVLTRDAWGQGYASEALRAILDLARSLALDTLNALCHPGHIASRRVLEKCGFVHTGVESTTFPNLPDAPRLNADHYAIRLSANLS